MTEAIGSMKDSARIAFRIAAGCLLLVSVGCAARKPLKGIPVAELTDDLRMPSRSPKVMIDPSLLRQTPPREHLVDDGDILGIYVEGILGGSKDVPPVNFRQNFNSNSSLGYPIRVRADGTISLPSAKPIAVRGMTIAETEKAIRRVYTEGEKPLLKRGTDRILVTLQRPRHYRVLVIRQESGNPAEPAGQDGKILANPVVPTNSKYGTGRTVDLPAYENDVLHALAETGGLPGLDAENVIYVIRRRPTTVPVVPMRAGNAPPNSLPVQPVTRVRNFGRATSAGFVIRGQSPVRNFAPLGGHSEPEEPEQQNVPVGPDLFGQSHVHREQPTSKQVAPVPSAPRRSTPISQPAIVPQLEPVIPGPPPNAKHAPIKMCYTDATIGNPSVIRIPLRLFPGEMPPFGEQDIILQDGDVVLIESRQTDVFYTGGLLGGGRFRLPRDQDLDVVQAMSLIQAERLATLPTRSIGGVSALNQDVTSSASDLIVLRPMPDGSQMPIRVNLYKAMRDPRERIFVKPGDHLVLQYTRCEAVVAFFERHILDGVVLGASSGLFFGN